MLNSKYFKKYQNLFEVLMNQGVHLRCEPGMLKFELNALPPPVDEIDDATEDELEDAKKRARHKYTTMAFIITSDCDRYATGVSSSALFSPALTPCSSLSAFVCVDLVHADFMLSP